MPEQTLGIILSASANNAAAYDQMIAKNEALKASSSEMNVIYGAQGQVLSDLNTVMDNASTTHQKVAKGASEAAAAERDLMRDGREAAKATGELGAKGAELTARFSALGGVMSSGGAMGIGIGAAIIGLGAIIEGGKKVSETYQEQQASVKSLQQAMDAASNAMKGQASTADQLVGVQAGVTGATNDQRTALYGLVDEYEKFAQKNAQFIPNLNDGRDVLASFVRAGFDSDTSMKALNETIDLAAIKNEDLSTAGKQVLLMMEGQGRVAKQLGIDIKALANSDDNAVTAHKNLEKANAEVIKVQDELTKALRSQKEEEDALAGKRKLSQHELDILQDKTKAVKDAQDKLTTATKDQKTAQDAANGSIQTSQQVLDQLSVKLDNGRNKLTDLQKQQNENKAMWDDFSTRSGPAVNYAFLVLEGTLSGIIFVLDAAAKGIQNLVDAASHMPSGGAPAPSGPYNPASHARASGGPVYPGGVYTVGERGPETLVMGATGGTVIPNSGGGGGQTVNVYVTTNADPDRIAREVAWAMKH
jgi:myosin heavy subunit